VGDPGLSCSGMPSCRARCCIRRVELIRYVSIKTARFNCWMVSRVAFFVWCIVATHTSTDRNCDQAATFENQDDVGMRLQG
jgi:hypothetical protein